MVRTAVGRDFFSDETFQINTTTLRPTQANIIALSETATTTASTHTVLGGTSGGAGPELATDGFARAVATYAHTASSSTASLTKTFTSTGGTHTIKVVGVFAQSNSTVTFPGAADAGILVFEMAEPSFPTLTNTDQLAQTCTIDFGA